MSTFHEYFDAEMGLLSAYDAGELTYYDAYRICFRAATNILSLDI